MDVDLLISDPDGHLVEVRETPTGPRLRGTFPTAPCPLALTTDLPIAAWVDHASYTTGYRAGVTNTTGSIILSCLGNDLGWHCGPVVFTTPHRFTTPHPDLTPIPAPIAATIRELHTAVRAALAGHTTGAWADTVRAHADELRHRLPFRPDPTLATFPGLARILTGLHRKR